MRITFVCTGELASAISKRKENGFAMSATIRESLQDFFRQKHEI